MVNISGVSSILLNWNHLKELLQNKFCLPLISLCVRHIPNFSLEYIGDAVR